jgi:signal transduction histidine kinase/CheY-like chemotaxis protein
MLILYMNLAKYIGNNIHCCLHIRIQSQVLGILLGYQTAWSWNVYLTFLAARLTKLLMRDYLSGRMFVAIPAIACMLVLIVAIGVHALSSFQTYSRFNTLFRQLFEVTMRLETELGWSLVQNRTPERLANLANRYREALAVFSALRATQADHAELPGSRWAVLEAEFGVDPEAERARFGLGAHTMPHNLGVLWHGEPSSGRSLEQTVAEFLTLTYRLVGQHEAGNAEHLRAIDNLRNLSQTKLFPSLHTAAQVVGESTETGASFGFYLLIACAGAGLLGTFVSVIFILRPMQRAVLNNQALLIKERDRALASERANRDLLAVISHELRTPMNGVIGFTDLLLATPLSAQQKDHAETIKESGQMLLELLNGLLELSKIEAGRMRLVIAEFSLAEVVNDVVTLLAPQAQAKRLDISAFIDPALPEMLRGDAGRIRQVLTNLVDNAIKFTVGGGVGIELRHEQAGETRGHTILLSVADTGIGIADDQRARIFERFTQVDSSSSRRFEGSGLGLSISRQLVEAMGGEIGVDSALDKGSTFWVRLTLASLVPPAASLSERANANFAGRRFLVVDDNALNRRIFRLQLESYGAEVECVPDARAALAALAQGESLGSRYDIAIVDQMMPETDGIALRRMIREDPTLNGLKLIISSSGGIAFDQQARALGFNAACPKPVMQDRLISTIKQLLAPSVPVETARPVVLLPSKPAAAESVSATKGKQPRLLVAEDNPINQRLILTALKQARFDVDVVSDGVEAVNAVERDAYDLVLMDIRMPVMDGVEATQRIRALPGPAARLPIIAMTANAMVGDREEYLAAGMDDYVAKPIDFNILLSKIRAHIPLSAAEATASTAENVPWVAEKKRG